MITCMRRPQVYVSPSHCGFSKNIMLHSCIWLDIKGELILFMHVKAGWLIDFRHAGFHEFAEFTAEDVGTVDSGLNSLVLASNNEMVILPINEPTHGTPR